MIEIPHCKNAGESTFCCLWANVHLFLPVRVVDLISKAVFQGSRSNTVTPDLELRDSRWVPALQIEIHVIAHYD